MGSRPRGGSNATKDGSVEARSSATAGRDRTLRSSAFAAERSPRGSRRPCRSARRTVSHTVISGTLSSFRAAASACGLFLARLHVDASASRAGTSLGGDPGAPAEAVGVAGRRSAGTSAHPSLGVRLRTRRGQAVLVGDGGWPTWRQARAVLFGVPGTPRAGPVTPYPSRLVRPDIVAVSGVT